MKIYQISTETGYKRLGDLKLANMVQLHSKPNPKKSPFGSLDLWLWNAVLTIKYDFFIVLMVGTLLLLVRVPSRTPVIEYGQKKIIPRRKVHFLVS